MEKKIAEEEAHQRKLEEMRTEMEERLQRLKLKRIKESTDGEKKQEEVVNNVESGNSKKKTQKSMKPEKVKPGEELEKKKSRKTKPGEVEPVAESTRDSRGAYRKHSTPKVARKLSEKSARGPPSLPESFLIGRNGDSTPFGHPGVPKSVQKRRSETMRKIVEQESEDATTYDEEEEKSSEE
ncbi:uncharacterized protein LOC110674396, partial [Aedes aegypti]|uniref:Uncharacterized protein n=1 Tax=Aedes aegypti TaxID=7159 RepID=A0A6I8U7W8_AEDAE